MVSLLSPLREIPLAFVDVETTGGSPDWGDRVIEIGAVRMLGGQRVGEYQQLIDPRRRVGPGITALTGITQEMVDGQPVFSDACGRLIELLSGAVVLGHNVRFDLSFLAAEFGRCGREMMQLLGGAHVLDTVRIARRQFGRGGNGLQRLSRRLGIEPVTAHRALADAMTTALVFERMLEPHGGWNVTLVDALAMQGGPMRLCASPSENTLPLELAEAMESRGTVMMEYLDARQARTKRLIQPLEIRRFKGEMMLIAHCLLRQDRRNFKLDRIVRLERIDCNQTADSAYTPHLPVEVEQQVLTENA
jgi:DNA polymerase III epsilon subunit family exonuclease